MENVCDLYYVKGKIIKNKDMQNQPKYIRTTEFISRETIEYKGIGGGKIHFDEMVEYRDFGLGPIYHKRYWVKYDDRAYTDLGRNYFNYDTKEAYKRALRYAKKNQNK